MDVRLCSDEDSAATMMPHRATIRCFYRVILVDTPIFALIGGPIAVAVAIQYGLPTHTVITFLVMAFATGLGTTLGFHRLFSHRSFATSRQVEWVLMILGCMSGQNSPFSGLRTIVLTTGTVIVMVIRTRLISGPGAV